MCGIFGKIFLAYQAVPQLFKLKVCPIKTNMSIMYAHIFSRDLKEHAEADCFFCFTNLMSDIRDFFIKSLDEAESGINGIMNRLMGKLGRLDPEVKRVLDAQDIRPQYFSFRNML